MIAPYLTAAADTLGCYGPFIEAAHYFGRPVSILAIHKPAITKTRILPQKTKNHAVAKSGQRSRRAKYDGQRHHLLAIAEVAAGGTRGTQSPAMDRPGSTYIMDEQI